MPNYNLKRRDDYRNYQWGGNDVCPIPKLTNYGSTCFISSVSWALMSLLDGNPDFYGAAASYTDQKPVVSLMWDFVQHASEANFTDKYYKPFKIWVRSHDDYPDFEEGQHDTQELLSHLVDGMPPPIKQKFCFLSQTARFCYDTGRILDIEFNEGSSTKPRMRTIKARENYSRLMEYHANARHDAKYVYTGDIPYYTLQLPINHSGCRGAPLDLCKLIYGYLAEEQEEADWKGDEDQIICPRAETTRQIKFRQFGEVVIIQLVRYSYDTTGRATGKISDPVHIPMELDLGRFLYIPKSTPYSLTSAILHHGKSPHGGHWTALVNWSDQWYNCDDLGENKPLNDIEEVHRMLSTGYIFIYKRGQPKPAKPVPKPKAKSPAKPQAKKTPAIRYTTVAGIRIPSNIYDEKIRELEAKISPDEYELIIISQAERDKWDMDDPENIVKQDERLEAVKRVRENILPDSFIRTYKPNAKKEEMRAFRLEMLQYTFDDIL